MPSRKQKILEKRKENRNLPHVTADDIVQAIEGVQAAGLEVYAVEITTTGSIKLSTGPSSGAIAPLTTTDASDDTQPKQKQAP
jgi:hypothetical protein